nr:hypothetical protein [Marinicella sp. W31]MDC2878309.1 hypothetical protein [Marinicella sp. W31]
MDENAEKRQAALDAREAELKNRETTFAETERKRRADDDAAFVSEIVKDGRLPVGLKGRPRRCFRSLATTTSPFPKVMKRSRRRRVRPSATCFPSCRNR